MPKRPADVSWEQKSKVILKYCKLSMVKFKDVESDVMFYWFEYNS